MSKSVEPTLVTPGGANRWWMVYFAAWLVFTGAVYATTDLGLYATVAGTAGVYFVYRGFKALWLAVASRSVEHETIDSLGGRSEPASIEGAAQAIDDPLRAPLTGTESVAYRVAVREHVPESQE